MGSFAFWVESLFFPLIALTINAVVRWRARMPQSAPADLILLLWVFDVAVILKADTYSQFSELLANPNDWRAFLHMRVPRKLSYPVVAITGLPTASSATIIVPPPWQSPPHGPSHLRDLHHDNTRTNASVVVVM